MGTYDFLPVVRSFFIYSLIGLLEDQVPLNQPCEVEKGEKYNFLLLTKSKEVLL